MGIIQNISYDKSRFCSISLDDLYFKHIFIREVSDFRHFVYILSLIVNQ